MRSAIPPALHHHIPQMLVATGMTLGYCIVVRALISMGIGFDRSATAAYGLMAITAGLLGAYYRDWLGAGAGTLLTILWCINTVIFFYEPSIIFHTIIFDIASIAILTQLQRPLVATFSAPMAAVGVLILLGFNARIVLNMLFFAQCLLLGMQNTPMSTPNGGKVVQLHDDEQSNSFKAAG